MTAPGVAPVDAMATVIKQVSGSDGVTLQLLA